ncbi:MAG: hypothetical protein AAF399_24275 [Bacteroidota bacterium]
MRILFLSLALLGGIFLPFGHQLTFLVRYSVMVMLFFAFLDIRIERSAILPTHGWIALANLGMAALFYFVLLPLGSDLAITGFITAIMPTAAAAPVLTSYLHGRVPFVTFSVILTTCLVGLVIPLVLPWIAGAGSNMSIGSILLPVLITILLPLLTAQAIRLWWGQLQQALLKVQIISYYLFLLNVYIAMSKASYFIQQEMTGSIAELSGILMVSALICGFNFGLGHLLGGPSNRTGGSMALGRKNTMFAVWVSLTYLSPLTALGPMGYIIWQNIWNSYQLMRQKKE